MSHEDPFIHECVCPAIPEGTTATIMNGYYHGSMGWSESPVVAIILSAFFLISAVIVTSFLLREMRIAERLRAHNAFTLTEYVAYRTDYYFSISIAAKPILLFFATIFLVISGGFAYSLVSHKPFIPSLWLSWSFIADPGYHADQKQFGERFVGLLLTLGGMMVFALLLSIVSDIIGEQVRKPSRCIISSNVCK